MSEYKKAKPALCFTSGITPHYEQFPIP